jgi:hypothetical protein
MAALATPAQLGAILKETIDPADASALLILDIASGMVRDYLQQEVTAVAADVALMDPINGFVVVLDELPVTAVTLVETFDNTVTPGVWTTADPTTYSVSKRTGVITALPWKGVTWPALPETWRVTYNHGFAVVPMSIVGVVLGVAAREWSNPGSVVDMERIGGYQVKLHMEATGYTPLEEKALARYVNPRIA